MIVDPTIEAYLHKVQPAPDAVLAEMEKVGNDRGFPIIGPLVGRLCEQLARAIGARSVFEMGSGFGYSTLWFARAVGDGGRVVHTDGDAAKSSEAKTWLDKAGLRKRVDFLVGDAVELLRADKTQYDVVFIDIDKEQYPAAWKVACKRVRVGGLIITDNTLWQGKVASGARDADTTGVREYTRLTQAASGYLTTIIPLRDGVSISLRLN